MFLPEDGTGIEGANSYVSIAAADAYFSSNRNSDKWLALSDSAKQAALIEATTYIEGKYRGTWNGWISFLRQGLAWPRMGAWDADGRYITGVPTQVLRATCELAIVSVDAPLDPMLDGDERIKSSKVGPIETEYDTTVPRGKVYPFVARLLNGLSSSRSGSVSLARA